MLSNYSQVLQSIKQTIKQSQNFTYRTINSCLIETYFAIGKTIFEQKKDTGWGAKIIDQLSKDLIQEYGNKGGWSVRNLKYMLYFYDQYKDDIIMQQLVAQIPRGQNIAIMEKCKNDDEKLFYVKLCIEKGLSRNVLIHQIEGNAWGISLRESTHNFSLTIPDESEMVQSFVKDEYILNFLGLTEPFAEKQLEKSLIENIKQFLLELGQDFCFIGNQFKLTCDSVDYFVDLLFYHRGMKRLFAIELKIEEFKPEFIGKMNFYLSLLDDTIKKDDEGNSIGIVLCKKKNKITVEYALRDTNKPIAVATYQIIAQLEQKMKDLDP